MNETQKTLADSIAHELKDLVKLYDFSEAVTVSPLSESENRDIGSDFTADSCRLAEEYLTRFT